MRSVDRLTLDEELIVSGLIREGWSAAAAYQRVFEDRFRRRSRSRSGEGTSLPSTDGLYSNNVNRISHAPNHQGNGMRDVEQTAQQPEEGVRGDD